MDETREATARPWVISRDYRRLIEKEVPGLADGYDSYTIAEVRFHSLIGQDEADANAALIVTAVNGRDALIAERDALREALEPFAKFASLHGGDHEFVDGFYGPTLGDCRKARAALSNSTGAA